MFSPHGWQHDLDIIDSVMKRVSDITDPEQMVQTYWDGIDKLLPTEAYVALSRRGVDPPDFLITRSSRFPEEYNPWTQRHKLPKLRGGILGEFAYANKPMVVEDLPSRLDPNDPGYFHLQGYASAVVLPQYEGGEGLNVSVGLFKTPGTLNPDVVPMMHWQASLFGRATLSLVLRNQLKEALANLDRELQVVGEIQRSLLPAELPSIPGFDVAACYATSARAGGDYYDFFPLADGSWGVFIADVSGHGTPAAVLMAITHAIAHTRPGSPFPPAELLSHLNRHLSKSYAQSGAFVTAFYGVIDPTGTTIRFASAGHNPPRLIKRDTVLSLGTSSGLPLGIVLDERYSEAQATIDPGDVLILYTDGITEAMSPATADGRRELFGVDRLDALVKASRHNSSAELLKLIDEELDSFTDKAPAMDDQTLVAIKRLSTSPSSSR